MLDRKGFLEYLDMHDEDLKSTGERVLMVIEETYTRNLGTIDYTPLKNWLLEVKAFKLREEKNLNAMFSDGNIDGLTTDLVYQMYLDTSENYHSVMTKTAFSRFLREHYGYKTELRHIPEERKTKRVYVKIN